MGVKRLPGPRYALSLPLIKALTTCGAQLATRRGWPCPMQAQKATWQDQGAQHVTWEAGPGVCMFSFKLQIARAPTGLTGVDDCFGGSGSFPSKL